MKKVMGRFPAVTEALQKSALDIGGKVGKDTA
jgi:hypothetical protein